jgi:cell division septum initiation protein DivIVA
MSELIDKVSKYIDKIEKLEVRNAELRERLTEKSREAQSSSELLMLSENENAALKRLLTGFTTVFASVCSTAYTDENYRDAMRILKPTKGGD